MLVEAVSLLLEQLNRHVRTSDGAAPDAAPAAIWGNIALSEHGEVGATLENHLVLTLVSIEEEAALKNGPAHTADGVDGVIYRHRPLHLNLNLLFTAHYRDYETALKRLAQVLVFFQGTPKLTFRDSPPSPPSFEELRLSLSLVSLSLEEINHLWGSLGGKEHPFVLYRGRLVEVRGDRVLDGGGTVRELEVEGVGLAAEGAR